ncbi:uncharacterized protein LOC127808391 [Diospyros lotus]|uniref:uncharacterized protein LOC127808391 n=1 Tax=Diospyros lotus TaxID=55363 RepID=UPI002250E22E|nr:uncharacterized protein LOC127808391 [Diospyros lotus]
MENSLPLSFFFTLLLSCAAADRGGGNSRTTILFNSDGRTDYNFDVYTLPVSDSLINAGNELKITDGQSVNYNGHFPPLSSSSSLLLSHPRYQTLAAAVASPPVHVVYVTERNGSSSIYLDAVYYDDADHARRRSMLQVPNRVQLPLVGSQHSNGLISLKDKPSLVGDYVVYVSTHEDSGVPRKSWAAVYSSYIRTGLTRRLSPPGVPDFSPAVSPSGVWTAVASGGEDHWSGDVEELNTDIYVFRTEDGSDRVKVVGHGGWPTWADDFTLYYHRKADDGWWSIYKASLPKSGRVGVESVVTQRITPPGIHAFTPAASVADKSFIAVATRRRGSKYRHIEIFDVVSNQFREVTRSISPTLHHFNPFISPDSTRVGYHRCRGPANGGGNHLLFEYLRNPKPEISLFRNYRSFPSFSPEGDRIAYGAVSGLYVVNSDGSGLREIYSGMVFYSAWDPKRKGVVYTSMGPIFAPVSSEVDIVAVNVDEDEFTYRKLTTDGKNNAFPSPSPDGKWIVFRSGRSGYKNLYIMDAQKGDKGGLFRLTEGPWTDTHCNWSPDGDWIVFTSNREHPGTDLTSIYMIHPNGTGLRKVFTSGSGMSAHPIFSPDGKSIVLTSDFAGVSAEPISIAHQYQPPSEIYTIKLDGSDPTRMTHNTYDDGTPAWGPISMRAVDVVLQSNGGGCNFNDCYWITFPDDTKAEDEVAPTLGGNAKIPCGN